MTIPTIPTITDEPFGEVDGSPVSRYTLASPTGVTVRILTYGGIVQSVHVPGADGRPVDLALGYPTLDEYVAHHGVGYLGALIGRYANRIAKGEFTLDGTTYRIPVNNLGNALHGGPDGFDRMVWTAEVDRGPDAVSLRLRHVSPDGEMGFPGTLTTDATYTLDASGRLTLGLHATTDRPTVVNLTNHAYWNLTGDPTRSVHDHRLQINAQAYTPVDPTLIPTGESVPVAGTPFDFTTPTAIGARIAEPHPQLLVAGGGYDLNWVLDGPSGPEPAIAVRVLDPSSGRTLTVRTTQPGLQFYTGVFPANGAYGAARHGIALEPQHFPDSPNRPDFPSVVLRPGQAYQHTIVYEVGFESSQSER
jgi:aldose 1-epimerase